MEIPKYSPTMEKALLGLLLVQADLVPLVQNLIGREDFYLPAHQNIYDTALSLVKGSSPLDHVSICQALQDRGLLKLVGGEKYLAGLREQADEEAAKAAAEHYAKALHGLGNRRRKQIAYQELAGLQFQDELDEAARLEREAEIDKALRETVTEEHAPVPLSVALSEFFDRLEYRKENPGLSGVPTGLKDMDDLTDGYQKGNLGIVAGRPGSGKTALLLHQAIAQAKAGYHVLVFSQEMSESQLAQRVMAREAKIDLLRLRKAKIEDGEWAGLIDALGSMSQMKVWIDPKSNATPSYIRSRFEQLDGEHRIDIIYVDHLGYMSDDTRHNNRVRELGAITKSLKALARDKNIPVVLLAQLNREVEKRSDHRPVLSDLRGSGEIDEDADTAIFLFRPEMYDPDTPEPQVMELIIAKQRDGPQGVVRVLFEKETGTFRDLVKQQVDLAF